MLHDHVTMSPTNAPPYSTNNFTIATIYIRYQEHKRQPLLLNRQKCEKQKND